MTELEKIVKLLEKATPKELYLVRLFLEGLLRNRKKE